VRCLNAVVADPKLARNDAVYAAACARGLHGALLAGFEAEEEPSGIPGRGTFVNWALRILFDGSRREVPVSVDERRVLGFLSSNTERAWPAWSASLLRWMHRVVALQQHERSAAPEIAAELLRVSVYALAHGAVADFVLTHHAEATWTAIAGILEAYWAVEGRGKRSPHFEPLSGGHMFTLVALLREHAGALKGEEWRDTHLPLAGVGIDLDEGAGTKEQAEKGVAYMQTRFAKVWGEYNNRGIAAARASIECKGKVTYKSFMGHLQARTTELANIISKSSSTGTL
jgi:hypothetical protein